MAKDNTKLFWIIGIVIFIFIFSNGGFLGSVVFTSNEPTTLTGYRDKLSNINVDGVILDDIRLDLDDNELIIINDITQIEIPTGQVGLRFNEMISYQVLREPCTDSGLEDLSKFTEDIQSDLDIQVNFMSSRQLFESNKQIHCNTFLLIGSNIITNGLQPQEVCGWCSDDGEFRIATVTGSNHNSNVVLDKYFDMMYEQTTIEDSDDKDELIEGIPNMVLIIGGIFLVLMMVILISKK